MSICVILHEQGQPDRTVSLARVPCAYEFIDEAGAECRVTSVKHMADTDIGVQAVVNVMRVKEAE